MDNTTTAQMVFTKESLGDMESSKEKVLSQALFHYQLAQSTLIEIKGEPYAKIRKETMDTVGNEDQLQEAMQISRNTIASELESFTEQQIDQLELDAESKKTLKIFKREDELELFQSKSRQDAEHER